MHDVLTERSASARNFEEFLPRERRKALGQFFTGMPLGRILAELAVSDDVFDVLDPMAGHGDLLESAQAAIEARGNRVGRLHGIEIDPETATFCRRRVNRLSGTCAENARIWACDAFDPSSRAELGAAYDLVIANPPYVRYQVASQDGRGTSPRLGLKQAVDERLDGSERRLWSVLARDYSGLADLSVPAWLLAGLLVRPGGRLAIVAPATWRTREYADIIRYFLLRCFKLEYIVEDTQPGWFSDALVRTHLIVARRLSAAEMATPLLERERLGTALWIQISPEAASKGSLVGAAFDDVSPEAAFAEWVSAGANSSRTGIETNDFDLSAEWGSLGRKLQGRKWLSELEPFVGQSGTLFARPLPGAQENSLPEAVTEALGPYASKVKAKCLRDLGVIVGQGLRTGCNPFFYLDGDGPTGPDRVRVVSALRPGVEFDVPATTLTPAIRRQSDLRSVEQGRLPTGYVLDLQGWLLAEDAIDQSARGTAKVMPPDLAAYVRFAASAVMPSGKMVPQLSAVATNERSKSSAKSDARRWYMLPDFAPRHRPAAFVPRVVNDEPWAERNFADPILVDANFSTIWSDGGDWTRSALKAVFNSSWSQLFMEALGTPLGGGALKLEAAHLRHLPLPELSNDERGQLDDLGADLSRGDEKSRLQVSLIVLRALIRDVPENELPALSGRLSDAATALRKQRLRQIQ